MNWAIIFPTVDELEVSQGERVQESPTPEDLTTIDFGDLPRIFNTITKKQAEEILRQYPFQGGYGKVPVPTRPACRPPKGFVAICTDQLEAGLRMPTPTFFRNNLRYGRARITQLIPSAIRTVVGSELICGYLEITLTVDHFRRFFTVKRHENEKGWFYFSTR